MIRHPLWPALACLALASTVACAPNADSKETGVEDADGDGSPAGDDCDDDDASALPGGSEVCDGVDNDCDGTVDDGPTDGATFYEDADADGWGNEDNAVVACATPTNFTAVPGDCDDGDPAVHPEAEERCDAVDRDCDGSPDAGAVDTTTWYHDADADGFGDPAAPEEACVRPDGTVEDATDCNDAAAAAHPGADEICGDALDDDCDDEVDEGDAVDATAWYADDDADGFGDPEVRLDACTQPDGYEANDDDCDDGAPDVRPDADEWCNGADDDCDGDVDEADAVDPGAWYADDDGDGYGAPGEPVVACEGPPDHVENAEDCDDGSDDVHPGAEESPWDGADSDCDGLHYAMTAYDADPYESTGLAGVGIAWDGASLVVGWTAATMSGYAAAGAYVAFDEGAPDTLVDGNGWAFDDATYLFDGRADFVAADGYYGWFAGMELYGSDIALTIWQDGAGNAMLGTWVDYAAEIGAMTEAEVIADADGTWRLVSCGAEADQLGYAEGTLADLVDGVAASAVGSNTSGSAGYDGCVYFPGVDWVMGSNAADAELDFYA